MSNVLSFDRLQKGLSKIQNLGLIEEDVEIHGMHFRIRTLRASEHKKVNEFVADYMDQYEGEESKGFPLDATMDFFTVRKIEPLTHAIIEIDDLNLRGIEYIETGERDQNGNPIKIEKHVFLRRMMIDMDVTVTDTLHSKYIDLISTAEEKAAEKVEFRNPEEELERVEARRRELLKELDREDELLEAQQQDLEEDEGDSQLSDAGGDEISRELRNAAFRKIDEGEEEVVIQEREQSRAEAPTPDEIKKGQQPPEPEPENVEREEFEEGTSKFIRLDDPETPYTEEEQMYLEEQEKLYRQKFGEGGPGFQQEPARQQDPKAQEAEAQLNKRRRKPLNQTAPQVQEGPLPSEQQMHRQPRVSKPQEDLSDMEIAEGYENTEPARLDRPPGQGPSEQRGDSTKNPNFKGNQ